MDAEHPLRGVTVRDDAFIDISACHFRGAFKSHVSPPVKVTSIGILTGCLENEQSYGSGGTLSLSRR